MKKILLLFTMLIAGIGSMWGQSITYGSTITATYGKGNGTFYNASGSATSSGFDAKRFVSNTTPAVTVTCSYDTGLNSNDAANVARLGANDGDNTYTISVPLGYVIDSYSFDYKAVNTTHPAKTLTTEQGTSINANVSSYTSLSETNINKQSTYFTITTTGWSPINTNKFKIKVKIKIYNVTGDSENLSDITDYTSFGSFNVPAGKTLNVDVDNFDLTKIHGAGTIAFNDAKTATSGIASDFTGTLNVNNASAAVTISGNLGACTIKKTNGTLTYTGTNLNGTTLDGVILGGSARINTSGTTNIKDIAGNNISGDNGYAFVGSGTLNFEGTCDLTHKADGTTSNENAKIGYASGNTINIKADATVTASQIMNSTSSDSNAPVNVASGATLITTSNIRSNSLTNNGTINATRLYGAVTLGEGSSTTLSNAVPLNQATSLTGTTVTGDATLNVTATTATLNQAITVADGKTLSIDGKNHTVNLTGKVTNNGTVAFKNATLTANLDDRSLTNYTFTDCTATLQFVETTDEYKAGGFTITNIPSGVTIKVKQYGDSDYETKTPTDGTVTISHDVEVSGSAAWLDYTFNMSTIGSNTHDPADRVISNAGNAGSDKSLEIDTGYDTSSSYNEDGTLKVMSTPYRDMNGNMAWPTNYTVAVAGNVPDVENGCLVAFGSTTNGSKKYLAIIRGASQNEIKLVKGNAYDTHTVISTMAATNATTLSHLVVFTKNGNTLTVYLDGIQKTQINDFSETLGEGFQLGSIHGGVVDYYDNTKSTGIERVSNMSDETAKAKVFAKTIRVYDYVISSEQMSLLTDEFPYVSQGGKYSRTISANSDLSATSAWLNNGTQGNVDVPVNATVEEVIYHPDVEITTTTASTLTVNADMDVENFLFEGAGKLTIANDETHKISVYGSVTANGPVSIKYGEIDLSAVPVTIGESGSLEFDFSGYDFSDFTQTAVTENIVTGNAPNYDDQVTAVFPSSDAFDFSLDHNSGINKYVLTVTPKLIAKKQEAIDMVTPYYNGNHVGTGVGKYTIKLGSTSYANLVDFGTAVTGLTTIESYVDPTITLNEPATGSFYRFHIGDNYMCNVAAENIRTTTTTADDASTIFYLDENNYLMAYADGFGFNYGYCKAIAPGIFNSFDFSESSTMCKYLVHSNPGTESNVYSNRYITVSGSNLAEGQGEWTIEDVSSLPVTITSVGWASTCLPVAVTIPDGVTAFRAEIDGDVVNLTSIDDAIPANTPVVLKGTANTYDFTTTTAGALVDENELEGTTATVAVSSLSSDYIYYTLRKTSGENKAGFYQKTEGNIQGFRAYLKVSASSGVRAFMIHESDDTTTGIENALGAKVNVDNCYDLQGRRITAPKKGLYIVNGKKVMF